MDTEHIVDRLRSLPPGMPTPADRFEQVEDRVRRRRRRMTGAAVAVCAILAVSVPLAVATGGSDDASRRDLTPAGPAQQSSTASPTAGPTEPPDTSGSAVVTRLADPTRAERTGTATVDLGPQPSGANSLVIELTCLTPGTFVFDGNGGSTVCGKADFEPGANSSASKGTVRLEPGQTQVTVNAGADESWRLVATYASSRTSDWDVNDSGQTYGAENKNGSPDLLRVVATNGRVGYAFAKELNSPGGIPEPRSRQEALEYMDKTKGKTFETPVYESDGKTQIGVFETRG